MRTALDVSLVELLGDSRARIVESLRAKAQTVADLAQVLGVSEVAVRRHLQVLEGDGLISAETVRRPGRGRPAARYALTRQAFRLFPDRSAEFANDLLAYLEDVHGRRAVREFLRWRQDRQGARYGAALQGAGADLADQTQRLAELLSEDGFASEVAQTETPDGRMVLRLTQGHCAIKDVAESHPEVCAYEAALFKRLLGAKVSRRQTIAAGDDACVCTICPDDKPTLSTGVIDGHQS